MIGDLTSYANNPGQYDARQWAMWLVLREMANALEFGYAKNLIGLEDVNLETAEKDIAEVERRWTQEWQSRDQYYHHHQGIPNLSSLPIEAKCYFYQRLQKARATKNEIPSYYPNNWTR